MSALAARSLNGLLNSESVMLVVRGLRRRAVEGCRAAYFHRVVGTDAGEVGQRATARPSAGILVVAIHPRVTAHGHRAARGHGRLNVHRSRIELDELGEHPGREHVTAGGPGFTRGTHQEGQVVDAHHLAAGVGVPAERGLADRDTVMDAERIIALGPAGDRGGKPRVSSLERLARVDGVLAAALFQPAGENGAGHDGANHHQGEDRHGKGNAAFTLQVRCVSHHHASQVKERSGAEPGS